MARPGWVTAVAVIGIILGGMGIVGGIESPFIPAMVSSQLNQLEARDSSPEMQTLNRLVRDLVHAMTDGAPFWFEWWLFLAAGLNVAVSGIYLYSSISLFRMRPWSASMFAWSSVFVVLLRGVGALVGVMVVPMLRTVAVVAFAISALFYLGMAALVFVRRKELSGIAPEGPP